MNSAGGIRRLTPLIVLVLTSVLLTTAARAALGGDVTSVQNDAVRMKGAVRSTFGAAYTVHEITAAGGSVVREYISPQGKVFAVSWHGPVLPDFQQLLGDYYADFRQGVQSRERRIRGPVVVEKPGVVIQSAGHMRNFMGRAYLTNQLPQGVSAQTIE
jgi:Protein of unknown function (DUF2844)